VRGKPGTGRCFSGVRGVPGFPHVFDLDFDLRSGVLFLTSSSEPLGEGDEVRNTLKTERSRPPQVGRGDGTAAGLQCPHERALGYPRGVRLPRVRCAGFCGGQSPSTMRIMRRLDLEHAALAHIDFAGARFIPISRCAGNHVMRYHSGNPERLCADFLRLGCIRPNPSWASISWHMACTLLGTVRTHA